MNEKEKLELAACTCFLDSYNSSHSSAFRLAEHRDKPDCFAEDCNTGEKIGIEITHLYYDSREAKMVFGRLSQTTHGVMALTQLIEKLNSDLAEKVNRAAKYEFEGKLILLIRVASPIFDMQDFEMYREDICVPQLNTFAEIWLLFRNQSSQAFSDLLQLQ